MMFVFILLNKFNILIFSAFTYLQIIHSHEPMRTGTILTILGPLINMQRYDKTKRQFYRTLNYHIKSFVSFSMGENNF